MDWIMTHRSQLEPVGCMYYAASAFLHELIDADLKDIDEPMFYARLKRKNILATALFEGRYTDQTFTQQGWERARSIAQHYNWPRFSMLIVIPSPRLNCNHMVAAQIQNRRHGDAVHISDSALPRPLVMTWHEFLESPYAQALSVLLIQLFPVLPAGERAP